MIEGINTVLLSCDHEVAMPGLVRDLMVVAGVEGLILIPPSQRNRRSLQIKYRTLEFSSLAYPKSADSFLSVEVDGIVGRVVNFRRK